MAELRECLLKKLTNQFVRLERYEWKGPLHRLQHRRQVISKDIGRRSDPYLGGALDLLAHLGHPAEKRCHEFEKFLPGGGKFEGPPLIKRDSQVPLQRIHLRADRGL